MAAGGRVAIVTGGASGIGEACARRFAQAGDVVVVADLDRGQGEAVARAAGGRSEFRALDVSDEAQVREFALAVEAAHGAPTVLVNCAGILEMPAPIADYPLDQHDRLWGVNYRGSYLMCRAFGSRMAELGRGAIVNISSVVGAFRAAPLLAYAPSKAAIKGLTESLACEFGPAGVRVNAVAPGATLTPPNRKRFESGQRDPRTWTDHSALRRLVLPEEIAEGIFFLCSPAAAAITGITLPIDAGWLAGSALAPYGGVKPARA
jgi:NAD(P)-dependent dehydrogenase (short-subunit alcohol dehydrogenase family)